MTMGEKILNMRKARGWSQEELAERVGVSRQAVSRWESGTAKPDVDKIIAICDLFGVSADYLLRDISGQSEVSAAERAEKKKIPWGAWAMTAFGAVTMLVLKILASVNRVHIGPVFEAQAGGGLEKMVTPGYYTGFGDYLSNTGLEWLAWLAGIALAVGGGWLVWKWYWGIWKKMNTDGTGA